MTAVFYVSPARLGRYAADCRSRLLTAFDVGVRIGIARLSGDGIKGRTVSNSFLGYRWFTIDLTALIRHQQVIIQRVHLCSTTR